MRYVRNNGKVDIDLSNTPFGVIKAGEVKEVNEYYLYLYLQAVKDYSELEVLDDLAPTPITLPTNPLPGQPGGLPDPTIGYHPMDVDIVKLDTVTQSQLLSVNVPADMTPEEVIEVVTKFEEIVNAQPTEELTFQDVLDAISRPIRQIPNFTDADVAETFMSETESKELNDLDAPPEQPKKRGPKPKK